MPRCDGDRRVAEGFPRRPMTATPDDKADDERRSSNAGLYLYSRLASSVLALITIALAARLYIRGDLAHAVHNGVAVGFLNLKAAVDFGVRTYRGEVAFGFVATILLMYDTAYALGSLGLPEA